LLECLPSHVFGFGWLHHQSEPTAGITYRGMKKSGVVITLLMLEVEAITEGDDEIQLTG